MKKLILTYNNESYGFDIERCSITDMGSYNQVYVYLNNKAHAQSLAFYPHHTFCGGVWANNPNKSYNFILRLQIDKVVDIKEVD